MKTTNENHVLSISVLQNVMLELAKRKTFTEKEVDEVIKLRIDGVCPLIQLDDNHVIIFPFQGNYAKKLGISTREGVLMTQTLERLQDEVEIPDSFFLGQEIDDKHQFVCFTGDLRTLKKHQSHSFCFDMDFLGNLMNCMK
jgi:hypothetical protein